MPTSPRPSAGDREAIRHIVVLGLMGAGKTTVGRLLAARLGWPLDDSDASIERAEGADVHELNERLGTDRMHELEAEHLHAALSAGRPSVVAAAASVIEDPDCRAELAGDGVAAVWLDVAIDRLAERFSEREHRPQLGDDPRTMLEAQLRERAPWFERICELRAEATDRSPEQTATEILRRLPPLER